MKGQFQSTESLRIRFPPFIDRTTGLEISSDICTVTVKKPNATTATYNNVSSPAVTFDSDVGMWVLDITTGSYIQGEWRAKAVTNAANANPQRKVYVWGDYVDTLASLTASLSSTLTQATTAATQSTAAAASALIIRKIVTNNWKIDVVAKKLFIYDDDGTTIIYTFNLKDENGLATATRIFERARV